MRNPRRSWWNDLERGQYPHRAEVRLPKLSIGWWIYAGFVGILAIGMLGLFALLIVAGIQWLGRH